MPRTLRELRTDRAWSQARLATAAGVAQKTIVDIESGAVHPKWRTIERISTALEVPAREVTEFGVVIDRAVGQQTAAE